MALAFRKKTLKTFKWLFLKRFRSRGPKPEPWALQGGAGVVAAREISASLSTLHHAPWSLNTKSSTLNPPPQQAHLSLQTLNPAACREVLVSRRCAESVLRGAHVFIPGILVDAFSSKSPNPENTWQGAAGIAAPPPPRADRTLKPAPCREVLVSRRCAESVLRGAHVHAPGPWPPDFRP